MSFIKRAFLYVARKWQQSMIVFLVLLVVCTSALVGLAILKASDTAAANLRGQFGGTFSLEIDMSNPANMQSAGSTDRYAGSYYSGDTIDNEVIDEVLKTPGIADYSANIEVVANLKSEDGQYYNLVENKQNYYSSALAHVAPIQGWTSLQQCSYFANGILEITQGEMFSGGASGQAVISRELADLNGLSVGDHITLEINRDVTGIDFPAETQECVFEIAGIFDILKEQLYIYVSNSMGGGGKKQGSSYLSLKAGEHGFGLMRVDQVVKRYNGYLNRQHEEGVFVTEIMLGLGGAGEQGLLL